MKCKHCGAEIPNDVKECPYCDAPTIMEETTSQNPVVIPVVEANENQSIVQEQQKSVITNPVMGRKYSFQSARGTNITGIFNSKVISNVEVAEDRLYFSITPKKYNVAPAILFQDITGVDISTKINLYYWIWIIITAIGGFAAPYLFIFTVIFFFIGRDRKITVSQRNGVNVVMYARGKTEAESFKNDLRQVAKFK